MKRFKLTTSPRTGIPLHDADPLEMNRPAEPDFAVRNLADYSTDELMALSLQASIGFELCKKTLDATTIRMMDVWAYRIKDALKEAAKREGKESGEEWTAILKATH